MAESKSAWLFNDFKEHLKKCKKMPLAFSIAWQSFPDKKQPPAGESVSQNLAAPARSATRSAPPVRG
jgi:hypothetical protein